MPAVHLKPVMNDPTASVAYWRRLLLLHLSMFFSTWQMIQRQRNKSHRHTLSEEPEPYLQTKISKRLGGEPVNNTLATAHNTLATTQQCTGNHPQYCDSDFGTGKQKSRYSICYKKLKYQDLSRYLWILHFSNHSPTWFYLMSM